MTGWVYKEIVRLKTALLQKKGNGEDQRSKQAVDENMYALWHGVCRVEPGRWLYLYELTARRLALKPFRSYQVLCWNLKLLLAWPCITRNSVYEPYESNKNYMDYI